MKTEEDRRDYQSFVKELKGMGYYMVQKSVYARYVESRFASSSECKRIANIAKPNIAVRMLTMPYDLFDSMYNINCDAVEFYGRKDFICV